jgi:hypothetical protein
MKRKREHGVPVRDVRRYRDSPEQVQELRLCISALLAARASRGPNGGVDGGEDGGADRGVDVALTHPCQRYYQVLRMVEATGIVHAEAASATFRLVYNAVRTRAWLATDASDDTVRRQVDYASRIYDDFVDSAIEECIHRHRTPVAHRPEDALSAQLVALAQQLEARESSPAGIAGMGALGAAADLGGAASAEVASAEVASARLAVARGFRP